MIKITDKLIAPSRGTAAQALSYARANGAKRLDFVEGVLNETERLCTPDDMPDFAIVVGRMADETGGGNGTIFVSPIFVARGNVGGLGVTDGADEGLVFDTPIKAARAMVAHMVLYATGDIARGGLKPSDDPRYNAYRQAYGTRAVATTLDALTGKWFTNPDGAINSAARGNRIFKDIPDQSTTPGGQPVPTPNIIDRYLHVAQLGYPAVNRRYIGRGGMSPKAIFVHIQDGNNLGSWQWFHTVTASATVLIGKNGDIWRLVPEEDGPWTNGDVQSPTARGRDLLNRYGADPNYYTLSIETEGFTTEWPKEQAQLDSVLWQIRTWRQKYPSITKVFIFRHADVNQVTRPACPGDTYFSYLMDHLDDDGAVEVKPSYAQANIILDGKKQWDGKNDLTVNTILFHGAAQSGIIARSNATSHLYATKDSPATRSTIKKGTSFSVLGWVNGEEVGGEKRWWITKNFGRVWVGNTKQKPRDETPAEDDDDQADGLPSGAMILNGRVYYPLFEDGTFGRKLDIVQDCPLYKSVTTKSERIGDVKKGDEVSALYYTFGEEVDSEVLWFILARGDSDPIRQGFRMPATATRERPD